MPNEMDQNVGDTKKGVDEANSLNDSQNRFLREKMESTLRKAREKVAEVQQDLGTDRFDKAWERVYGNKQYRPSWIGKLQNRGSPPTKFKHHARNKKQAEPSITEDKKEEEDALGQQTEGIPDQFRSKKVLEPLKIKGKVVPNEQALDKWRKEIDTGEATNNKIVKQTNVTGWIDNNQYWKQDMNFMAPKPIKKKFDSQKVPENQKINTEKYDMIGKYENRVQKDDLKIGNKVVPKERDLKKWGDELEIPDNLTRQDFSVRPSRKPMGRTSGRTSSTVAGVTATGGASAAGTASGKETEGQKKWNKVLKTADVPNFLANGYW